MSTLCPKCGKGWNEHEPVETLQCPSPTRPDDMGELARLVAKELRKRGVWALALNGVACVNVTRFNPLPPPGNGVPVSASIHTYCVLGLDFDNLTPSECADVIQRGEATKAAEWAGDE